MAQPQSAARELVSGVGKSRANLDVSLAWQISVGGWKIVTEVFGFFFLFSSTGKRERKEKQKHHVCVCLVLSFASLLGFGLVCWVLGFIFHIHFCASLQLLPKERVEQLLRTSKLDLSTFFTAPSTSLSSARLSSRGFEYLH